MASVRWFSSAWSPVAWRWPSNWRQGWREIEPNPPSLGRLDVSFYRDDIALRRVMPHAVTDIPVDLTNRIVVLVDDVLFTGRTARAALDALNDHGRPRAVQLAVMVDRGHRELPIRPDFVGKNLPTAREEDVEVGLDGVDILRRPAPGGPGSGPRAARSGAGPEASTGGEDRA